MRDLIAPPVCSTSRLMEFRKEINHSNNLQQSKCFDLFSASVAARQHVFNPESSKCLSEKQQECDSHSSSHRLDSFCFFFHRYQKFCSDKTDPHECPRAGLSAAHMQRTGRAYIGSLFAPWSISHFNLSVCLLIFFRKYFTRSRVPPRRINSVSQN